MGARSFLAGFTTPEPLASFCEGARHCQRWIANGSRWAGVLLWRTHVQGRDLPSEAWALVPVSLPRLAEIEMLSTELGKIEERQLAAALSGRAMR